MRFPQSKYQTLLVLLIGTLFCFDSFAQTVGNEWIDYNKQYYKIKVPNTGLYRITQAALAAQPSINLSQINGTDFSLFHRGESVPIYVTNNGTLGSGDYIEFFGKRNDGSFDTQLFDNAADQINPHFSLYNDTSVYFLTWGPLPDTSVIIENVANDLTNLPSRLTSCTHHYIDEEIPQEFFSGQAEYRSDGDGNEVPLYESTYSAGEGFMSERFADMSGQNFSKQYTLPGGVSLSGNATLKVGVLGIGPNNTQHDIQILWNGQQLGSDSYTGYNAEVYTFTLNPSSINSTNTLIVNRLGTSNNKRIGLVELTYTNNFDFGGNNTYEFIINGSTGAKYLEINNFNDNGQAPILYDLTNSLRIVGSQGGNPHRFKLPSQPSVFDREVFLSSQGGNAITIVNSVELTPFVDYNALANQGNYIIISHPKLFDDGAGTNWVDEYKRYRESVAGGGYRAVIVSINQLYEQFAFGIRKHPLAIRNFVTFMEDNWAVEPEFVFIIGKGRQYNSMRKNQFAQANYSQCLIPTYGEPGSDNLLTAANSSIIPRISIGRLSVQAPTGVEIYYQKIVDFESVQAEVGDPFQTIANKLWMKESMHLGGGNNVFEQATFCGFLDQYEETIEGTSYGGNVTRLCKSSTAPIQLADADFLVDRISDGVSIINFFGHSSPNSFDFSIDNPDNWNNYKKYPVVMSNGCFSGNIYNSGTGISEDYVLTEGGGAIAFLASISLSVSTNLDQFTSIFYDNISTDLYEESLGGSIKNAIEQGVPIFGGNFTSRMVFQQMTLHGDPAVRVNPHEKPDWALEAPYISFNPFPVSANATEFEVRVIVANLGQAIDDTIVLNLRRVFPDGSTIDYDTVIQATTYLDTILLTIPTGGASGFGPNTMEFEIESQRRIDELSETNNRISIPLTIISEDVFPIYPYEFAIVPEQGVTLYASTANAFADTRTYTLEIDTTERFNSSLKQGTTITQSGGILRWTPTLTYQDSVVYYWRVGIDSTINPGLASGYNKSSFIYLNGEFPGWNQSHLYQYLKDDYTTMYIDSNDREFKYVDAANTVVIKTGQAIGSGIPGASLASDLLAYTYNGEVKKRWTCGGDGFVNGFTFAVFDPVSGEPWYSDANDVIFDPTLGTKVNPNFGCIHCFTNKNQEAFMFPTNPSNGNYQDWMDNIRDFIDLVPDGHYILLYSVNAGYVQSLRPDVKLSLTNLGSSLVNTLNDFQHWSFFVQKGNPSSMEESFAAGSDILDATYNFTINWFTGDFETPLIGPANDWGSVHWRTETLDTVDNDATSIDVIGVNATGQETVLIDDLQIFDQSLQTIDATTYPLLKLRYNSRDDSSRTPAQLIYWRVLYDKVPEAALNAFAYFNFQSEQLTAGENLEIGIEAENVTELDMDSLLVKYEVLSNTGQRSVEYKRFDSLLANQTVILDYSFSTNCTNCVGDINTITVEINPDDDQPEQFHFNNIGIKQFEVIGDIENPLLDVTFDGRHIINGDIVSAEPEIQVTLKDENLYLLLDTTSIKILITDPNGTIQQLSFADFDEFIPGRPGNNSAQIRFKRAFEVDGTYELLIQAQDKSKNASGTFGDLSEGYDYRVSFEVINQSMITNMVNYPNPFTTATRFVFTLTGSAPPEFMKIQIYTVSGKVVREIMLDELGPLNIGNNITEFAWDGTDQYGDPLGNGLYLFRVSASSAGEKWESLESGADKWIENGFGKMYLAR